MNPPRVIKHLIFMNNRSNSVVVKYLISLNKMLFYLDDFPNNIKLQNLEHLIIWFNQYTIRALHQKISLEDLLQSYHNYCAQANQPALKRRAFSRLVWLCLFELEQIELSNNYDMYSPHGSLDPGVKVLNPIETSNEKNPSGDFHTDAEGVISKGSRSVSKSPRPSNFEPPIPPDRGDVHTSVTPLGFYRKKKLKQGIFFYNLTLLPSK